MHVYFDIWLFTVHGTFNGRKDLGMLGSSMGLFKARIAWIGLNGIPSDVSSRSATVQALHLCDASCFERSWMSVLVLGRNRLDVFSKWCITVYLTRPWLVHIRG